MVGANYMGGKRNAAKVRSKDTSGRIQKSFFGKQRFDLLAGGLRGNRSNPGSGKDQSEVASKILLAHARRGPLSPPTTDVEHIPPYTPTSNLNVAKVNSVSQSVFGSGCGHRTRPSKVLNALEMSDPVLLRVEMDRILAIPDLAGLTGLRTFSSNPVLFSPKRPRSRELTPPRSLKKRPRLDSDSNKECLPNSIETTSIAYPTAPQSHPFYSEDGDFVRAAADQTIQAGEKFCASNVNRHEEFQSIIDSIPFCDVVYSDFEEGLQDGSLGYIGDTSSELGPAELDKPDPCVLYSTTDSSRFSWPQLHQNEEAITTSDKCLPNSSSSSLGLFLPQTPEPPAVFTRFPRPATLATRQSQISPISPDKRNVSTPASSFVALSFSPPPATYKLITSSNASSPLNSQDIGAQAFNQHYSHDHHVSESSQSGQLWNLFDEPDPWNAIGRILGLETHKPENTGSSLEDDMRKFMANDRSGVGYVPPKSWNKATSLNTTELLPKCNEPPVLDEGFLLDGADHVGATGVVPRAMEMEPLAFRTDQTEHGDIADVKSSNTTTFQFRLTSNDPSVVMNEFDNSNLLGENLVTSLESRATVEFESKEGEGDVFQCPCLFSDSSSDSDEE